MNKLIVLTFFICSFTVFADEQSEAVEDLDYLAVEGEIYPLSTVKLLPESSSILTDTADVLKKMPGAFVNKNGALSGIAQYRGMFGSRVNVNADGVEVVESCSNAMDAAMSHVPASLVDAVILQRGISPVSQAIETMGGSIDVIGKSISSENDGFTGEINLGYASVNNAEVGSISLNNTKNQHGVHLGVNFESGGNQTFPGGENVFTGLERNYYTASYQYENQQNSFTVSTNYNDTGETGTPALPMDITYAKGGISAIDWTSQLNDTWRLQTKLAYQSTDHLMDNYRHRNQLPAAFRESLTAVERKAFSIKALNNSAIGQLEFGLDVDDVSNTAYITNPNNDQFNITNFDATKQRTSLFAEYQREVNEFNIFLLGLRWSRVDADSAEVNSSVAMMDTSMGQLHRVLRDRFNSADRKKQDNNVDLMLTWQQKINDRLGFEYGFAIKNRAPTHQERYLWLPLEATAGLADGRQYLGNLDLASEQAFQFEFGLNFNQNKFQMSPHVFYHRINDYIQGVTNTVMPAPPNTLRFDNVEAEVYGFDVELSFEINAQFTLSNVTSYVRGKRRDITDNLYRIAPANTWLNLSYTSKQWQIDTEWMAALKQDKVASSNDEKETAGYGIINWSVSRTFRSGSLIKLAINNVFDKLYYDHTNGYNRNNRNVDVGFDPTNLQAYRLPSEGRGVSLSYFYGW